MMEEESIERSESSKWQALKRKLGFRALACCGSLWAAGPSRTNHMTLTEDESSQEYQLQPNSPNPQHSDLHCLVLHRNPAGPAASTEEMNLAAALAAERQLRASTATTAETPTERISLMRLLEEKEREKELGEGLNCCVCMGREKGAAFIPCGHTFCRVCARELWLNRGACPLCNRSILEILDIF